MVRASFYQRLDEGDPGGATFQARYASTEHTVGPWAPDQQHGGPPTALALRAVERLGPLPERALPARVTAEIFSPVPVDALWVHATLVRPGRRVAWATADLGVLDRPDRPVMRLAVWLVRRLDEPAGLPATPAPPAPGPGTTRQPHWSGGYLRAVRWDVVDGSFDQPGPATVWTDLLVDLVDGEPPTGPQRVAVVADAGNGLSAMADPREVLFVNTELTVHLHREPVGHEVWMAAETLIDPSGIGQARTHLGDADGEVATASQTLFVQPR